MIGVQEKNYKSYCFNSLNYSVIFIYLLFVIFPIIWIVLLSLKTEVQAFANPPLFIFKPNLMNYYNLFVEENFGKYLFNSIFIASLSSIVCLLIGAPTAFALSRNQNKTNQGILIWVLISRMAPAMTYVIPFFVVFSYFKMIDTYFGLILAYSVLNLPLVIWLMRSFFLELPSETLEAAKIDGASHLTTFYRLALPLSIAGIAAFATFQFLWVYNDFLVANVFLGINPRNQVITSHVAQLTVGNYGEAWHLRTAGAVISMIVPLIVFFSLQRFFIRGLIGGAVKG